MGRSMSTVFKRIISIIVLIVLIIGGLILSSNILQEKHRSMQVDTFYNLKKNSVDVLFVGSSRYVRGISPNVIYEKSGISSYNRSTELLSAQGQYLYVVDSFKTQKPKVVFLSTARLQNGYNDKRDMHFHFGMAKARLSADKLKVALNYENESETMKALDIMFPVFKYHYRWNQVTYRDVLSYSNIETKGQDAYWKISDLGEEDDFFKGRINEKDDTEATYDPLVKEYLDKTIKYCKENGAQVVICNTPSNTWNQEKYVASKAVAEEHDVLFLDCNVDENLELIEENIKTDWHDQHEHLNGWGSYKLSSFIADYLEDNFELTDYRSQKNKTADSLSSDYEEFYTRYHMFLPGELDKPDGYKQDNVANMKSIPESDEYISSEVYEAFEKELTESGYKFKDYTIDVSSLDAVSGKRYELKNDACIILVEYKYESKQHIKATHNRMLKFSDDLQFPIIDPVNSSGFIMAFDGTKTKEQAMELTKMYSATKQ